MLVYDKIHSSSDTPLPVSVEGTALTLHLLGWRLETHAGHVGILLEAPEIRIGQLVGTRAIFDFGCNRAKEPCAVLRMRLYTDEGTIDNVLRLADGPSAGSPALLSWFDPVQLSGEELTDMLLDLHGQPFDLASQAGVNCTSLPNGCAQAFTRRQRRRLFVHMHRQPITLSDIPPFTIQEHDD